MKFNKLSFPGNAVLLVVLGGFVLSACSKSSAPKSGGQAVARVDGYELTVHQLNNELAVSPHSSSENDAARKSRALDSLINRRLLVAEAENAKLDRDPQVMQAIERQKEELLVQALLQRKADTLAKPTANEVHAYYQANPALFADQKIYEMRQISITGNSLPPELNSYLDTGKSFDEVHAWLEKNKVPYSIGLASRSTLDLPQQVVDRLDTLNSGKPFVVKDSNQIVIASLRPLKNTPVDEEAARPQIEKYLANRKMRDVANTDLMNRRKSAKIEYLDPSLAPGSIDSTKSMAKDGAHSATKIDEAVSKGVSGL